MATGPDKTTEIKQAEHDDAHDPAIRHLKTGLTCLGFYTPDPKTGIGDDSDAVFKDALYAFQRRHMIPFGDDALRENSLTQRILTQELHSLDKSALFVWHTVGDDKTRNEHAARQGRRFLWAAPPDGEYPGEDYNCRCWAEPLSPPRHPWIDWARERRERNRTLENARAKLAPPAGLNADPVLTQPGIDAIEPVSLVWTAAAVLAVMKAGGTVPIATIIKVLQTTKPIEALKQKTIDRRIYKRPKGIPKDWEAVPTAKGGGVVYKHPTEGGTYVKVQKANPESLKAGQRYDNVRWQKKEVSYDVDGNIVKKASQKSHIPLKDFKFDLEKMK